MGKKGRQKHKHRAPGSGSSVHSTPSPPQPSLRPSWFDPELTRARVERALVFAGPSPHVGIQEFIAANGRPLAMEGASQLVKRFDASHIDGPHAAGTVFAGGGRGLKLVPGEQLHDVMQSLQARYFAATCGGQLAIAHVPLDRSAQALSLRWLRMCLDGAKDRARPPEVPLPDAANEICNDCKTRARATTYRGPEGPVHACRRCAAVVLAGRESGSERHTFEDIAKPGGAIAVVCADGNNLGALFADLDLEEQALCSDLVSAIFERAHQAACPPDKPFVAPVVGGDDVRVFLHPESLLPYVTRLARTVHELSEQASNMGLPRAITQVLRRLGVGVGAVIAPFHYPAHRLVDMAHEFEDAAKRACSKHDHRSAIDFVWLRSGEELSEGVGSRARSSVPLGTREADDYMARARAIGAVPSSQRGMIVSARADLHEDEFMNLFCYQIARSETWQAWFEACGVDWRDRSKVAANLPDKQLLDVALLLSGGWP
jgi:hypothetical protein